MEFIFDTYINIDVNDYATTDKTFVAPKQSDYGFTGYCAFEQRHNPIMDNNQIS